MQLHHARPRTWGGASIFGSWTISLLVCRPEGSPQRPPEAGREGSVTCPAAPHLLLEGRTKPRLQRMRPALCSDSPCPRLACPRGHPIERNLDSTRGCGISDDIGPSRGRGRRGRRGQSSEEDCLFSSISVFFVSAGATHLPACPSFRLPVAAAVTRRELEMCARHSTPEIALGAPLIHFRTIVVPTAANPLDKPSKISNFAFSYSTDAEMRSLCGTCRCQSRPRFEHLRSAKPRRASSPRLLCLTPEPRTTFV